eukprot:363795-Chlamydomonas_euryale.AAC.8
MASMRFILAENAWALIHPANTVNTFGQMHVPLHPVRKANYCVVDDLAHRQACRQTGGQATRAIASTAAPAAAVASAWRAQGAGGHLHVVHIELAGVGQFARWCVDVHTGKGQPPESGSTLVDASASAVPPTTAAVDVALPARHRAQHQPRPSPSHAHFCSLRMHGQRKAKGIRTRMCARAHATAAAQTYTETHGRRGRAGRSPGAPLEWPKFPGFPRALAGQVKKQTKPRRAHPSLLESLDCPLVWSRGAFQMSTCPGKLSHDA